MEIYEDKVRTREFMEGIWRDLEEYGGIWRYLEEYEELRYAEI